MPEDTITYYEINVNRVTNKSGSDNDRRSPTTEWQASSDQFPHFHRENHDACESVRLRQIRCHSSAISCREFPSNSGSHDRGPVQSAGNYVSGIFLL